MQQGCGAAPAPLWSPAAVQQQPAWHPAKPLQWRGGSMWRARSSPAMAAAAAAAGCQANESFSFQCGGAVASRASASAAASPLDASSAEAAAASQAAVSRLGAVLKACKQRLSSSRREISTLHAERMLLSEGLQAAEQDCRSFAKDWREIEDVLRSVRDRPAGAGERTKGESSRARRRSLPAVGTPADDRRLESAVVEKPISGQLARPTEVRKVCELVDRITVLCGLKDGGRSRQQSVADGALAGSKCATVSSTSCASSVPSGANDAELCVSTSAQSPGEVFELDLNLDAPEDSTGLQSQQSHGISEAAVSDELRQACAAEAAVIIQRAMRLALEAKRARDYDFSRCESLAPQLLAVGGSVQADASCPHFGQKAAVVEAGVGVAGNAGAPVADVLPVRRSLTLPVCPQTADDVRRCHAFSLQSDVTQLLEDSDRAPLRISPVEVVNDSGSSRSSPNLPPARPRQPDFSNCVSIENITLSEQSPKKVPQGDGGRQLRSGHSSPATRMGSSSSEDPETPEYRTGGCVDAVLREQMLRHKLGLPLQRLESGLYSYGQLQLGVFWQGQCDRAQKLRVSSPTIENGRAISVRRLAALLSERPPTEVAAGGPLLDSSSSATLEVEARETPLRCQSRADDRMLLVRRSASCTGLMRPATKKTLAAYARDAPPRSVAFSGGPAVHRALSMPPPCNMFAATRSAEVAHGVGMPGLSAAKPCALPSAPNNSAGVLKRQSIGHLPHALGISANVVAASVTHAPAMSPQPLVAAVVAGQLPPQQHLLARRASMPVYATAVPAGPDARRSLKVQRAVSMTAKLPSTRGSTVLLRPS
eukprot:TRINITY_DN52160_c0_g1_i1.p1 TRINITY_DN52160_c0_g1~~TRINITY_DN52160_c0_g1_i1.p1  ORF type:complete len:823 (-),score=138.71 TRINITY_DN52160_c0_g1_i1:115-2583(-)